MSTDPKRWVAGHVAALPKSGIRDFFELVAKMKGQGVISLGVGEPDFVTPWHIREAAIYALEKGKTHYTSNLGLIELRRAICGYVGRHYSLGYQPESEVLITVGVSEALDLVLRALVNPGDTEAGDGLQLFAVAGAAGGIARQVQQEHLAARLPGGL